MRQVTQVPKSTDSPRHATTHPSLHHSKPCFSPIFANRIYELIRSIIGDYASRNHLISFAFLYLDIRSDHFCLAPDPKVPRPEGDHTRFGFFFATVTYGRPHIVVVACCLSSFLALIRSCLNRILSIYGSIYTNQTRGCRSSDMIQDRIDLRERR